MDEYPRVFLKSLGLHRFGKMPGKPRAKASKPEEVEENRQSDLLELRGEESESEEAEEAFKPLDFIISV